MNYEDNDGGDDLLFPRVRFSYIHKYDYDGLPHKYDNNDASATIVTL